MMTEQMATQIADARFTTDVHGVTVDADRKGTVYLSGPMTGLPDFNYPTFAAAAERLRSYGLQVLNPAENHDGRTDLPRDTYMRTDVAQVLQADAVVLLEGWQDSPGARLEVLLAQELGLQLLEYPSMLEVEQRVHSQVDLPVTEHGCGFTSGCPTCVSSEPETVTAEAERLVYGDRGASYGHPREDYTRTAQMWSAILGANVTPEQAIMCMIAVKLSREVNAPKRDNRTDIAGYALCLDRVETGL